MRCLNLSAICSGLMALGLVLSQPASANSRDPLPGLIKINEVVTGVAHTCAHEANGRVWCWGRNNHGQLGVGDLVDRSLPTEVLGLPAGVSSLASGFNHTCAVLTDDSVWCWGNGDIGQVGIKTIYQRTPIRVPFSDGHSKIKSLSLGGDSSFALLDDGSVWGWGGAVFEHVDYSGTPFEIINSTARVVNLSAGAFHTCMASEDGSLRCFGINDSGQLGTGDTEMYLSPKTVLGISGKVTSVVASVQNTCALVDDGSVWCWGQGAYGQNGIGNFLNQYIPVKIATLPEIAFLMATGSQSCSILKDGSVACWGNNETGQMGLASMQNHFNMPTYFEIDGTVTGFSSGFGLGHRCVVFSNCLIKCMGSNTYGQLGYGDFKNRGVTETVNEIDFVDLAR